MFPFFRVARIVVALSLLLALGSAPPVAAFSNCPREFAGLVRNIRNGNPEALRVQRLIALRKATIAYPNIPSVEELHLPMAPPSPIGGTSKISAGVTDSLLEAAREAKAFDDFKPLSDGRPLSLTKKELRAAESRARETALTKGPPKSLPYRQAFLKSYIESTYDFSSELVEVPGLEKPRWRINTGNAALDRAFAFTEEAWGKLLRVTKPKAGGSLLGLPYPQLVPGGRFQEGYYWDTYFAIKGLLATDRLEVAQMQTENLLSLVQRYGFVPNGNRDYYLTRSQPPFLSSAVREVYLASLKKAKTPAEVARLRNWLEKRALPLVKADYEKFWMNPETRYDAATGLNHHWDDANLMRPERSSHDEEAKLGLTLRDVRAGAESGEDFTDAHAKEATSIAGVLLQSVMRKTESDLAWMANELNLTSDAKRFSAAVKKRDLAMRKYLWNEEAGRFDNYHLREKHKINALTADTFAPLFVGMASKHEAALVVSRSLPKLERKGGIMASNLVNSIGQWDGENAWASQMIMAVGGLKENGYEADAQRIARKWTSTNARIYAEHGAFYERINPVTGSTPLSDEKKYAVQGGKIAGFLWTNSSYQWMLLDVLKVPKIPLAP